MSQDFTHRLRELMQAVGFSSFKALSRAAGVSEKQILRLRRGEIASLRVDTLLRLSQTLQVPMSGILAIVKESSSQEAEDRKQEAGFDVSAQPHGRRQEAELKALTPLTSHLSPLTSLETQNLELKTQNAELHQSLLSLQHEYDRLQQQLIQQRQTLWQEFQQASVQTLESLLLQLPTAAYAAQQNPQATAIKLLPLLRPLDRLLEDWGIEPIAAVGAEIPYEPQYHQLMAGTAQAGDQVKVRYVGYRQGDRVLYRAKVSPLL
jgi:molecular chaperone GrpE (heat shock protein)